MRRVASHPPRIVPYDSIASAAYAEQLGTNRHRGGNSGLTQRL